MEPALRGKHRQLRRAVGCRHAHNPRTCEKYPARVKDDDRHREQNFNKIKTIFFHGKNFPKNVRKFSRQFILRGSLFSRGGNHEAVRFGLRVRAFERACFEAAGLDGVADFFARGRADEWEERREKGFDVLDAVLHFFQVHVEDFNVARAEAFAQEGLVVGDGGQGLAADVHLRVIHLGLPQGAAVLVHVADKMVAQGLAFVLQLLHGFLNEEVTAERVVNAECVVGGGCLRDAKGGRNFLFVVRGRVADVVGVAHGLALVFFAGRKLRTASESCFAVGVCP